MNRTIKDATVKRFHYDDHAQLRSHLEHFIAAYNFGRRLKTLRGLTPYEFICKKWTNHTRADVYFGCDIAILRERDKIKKLTIRQRRLQHQKQVA